MTDEELKKKICRIIADNYLPKEMPDRLEDYKLYRFERAAEALIAAGFGDVESWKISDADKERSSINYYCEMREWKDRCKEAEHRAEVAEKELLVYKEVVGAMLCEIDCFNEGYCPEFYKDPECENCIKKKIYGNSAATFPCLLDKYIQQAEKELQEEKKSD